ncbi:MAG: 50S ribosomal protein L30 [Lachnospiraceae bacterium]
MAAKEQNMLKVTLVKSTIGAVPKHKLTVKAMGLKKLNKTVILPDNDATRGMVQQVNHLVKVESVSMDAEA